MCVDSMSMLTTNNGISPLKLAYISQSVAPIPFIILSHNIFLTMNDIITTAVANHPNISIIIICCMFRCSIVQMYLLLLVESFYHIQKNIFVVPSPFVWLVQ